MDAPLRRRCGRDDDAASHVVPLAACSGGGGSEETHVVNALVPVGSVDGADSDVSQS